MARVDRQRAERKGRRGEWLAALALLIKGYRILARRVRTPRGEVDLIARRGNLLAFVEVKARPNVEDALEAVSARAWNRISAAAELWARQRFGEVEFSWRYDVVAICPGRWPIHLRDVWRPDFAKRRG
ncbi:MAG: YraN family protein [Pseudomonadota bacterium]